MNPHNCKLPVLADRTFIKGNLISKIFLKATRGTLKPTTSTRAIRAVSIIRKPLSQIHAATRIQVHLVTWQHIIWLISSHIATVNQPVETDARQKQIKYYQMVAIGSKDLPAVTLPNTGEFADFLRELPTHAHFAFTPHCTDVHFCVWFFFHHLIIFTFLPNCNHQVACRFKT